MRKGSFRTSNRPEKIHRDFYDKLEVWGKISTGVVVVFISIVGSYTISNVQEKSRSAQLYSQFMSEREKAESDVRKDMFEKVIKDFWDIGHQIPEECVLDKIDRQILQLNLLSRNFHETLDMSPLFNHVLLGIVTDVRYEKLLPGGNGGTALSTDDQKTQACYSGLESRLKRSRVVKFFGDHNHLDPDNKNTLAGSLLGVINKYEKGSQDIQQEIQKDFARYASGDHVDTGRVSREISKNIESIHKSRRYGDDLNNCKSGAFADCLVTLFKKIELGKIRERKRNQLISIAKRITAKQMESLSDVAVRVRLKVNLDDTCKDKKPFELIDDEKPCKEGSGRNEESNPFRDIMGIEGYKKCRIDEPSTMPMWWREWFHKDGGEGDGIFVKAGTTPGRCIKIVIDRSYPAWDQVYVKVETEKTKAEQRIDPGDPENKQSFWLSYFDFPLSDNTYLSSAERYAVVLDDIKDVKAPGGKAPSIQQAEVSLIYFPATYAGFKEKAFYQQRMLNTLIKDND